MSKYIFTIDELNEWVKDETINPRTRRKIQIGKSVWKQLDEQYKPNKS